MSIQMMAAVLERDRFSTGNERVVLLALAQRADDDGVCFPSQERIARESNVSIRTVRSMIKSLCDLGVVQVLEVGRRYGEQSKSTRYRLWLDQEDSAGLVYPMYFAMLGKGVTRDECWRYGVDSQPAKVAGRDRPNRQNRAIPTGNGLPPNLKREPSSTSLRSVLDDTGGPDDTGPDLVWAAYQAHHATAVFDAKRRRLVNARLADGFTVDQLVAAIAGCHSSPWHQGENDRHRKYDSLELILRDADHVERFIALNTTTPATADVERRPGFLSRRRMKV